MKTYIDNSRFIEIISNLAGEITVLHWGEKASFIEEENGDTRYTEEAQDCFNEKYDEIESLFHVTLNLYSDKDKPKTKVTKKDKFVWLEIAEKASAIFDSGLFELYALYDDDSESLIESQADIKEANSKGLKIGIGLGFVKDII